VDEVADFKQSAKGMFASWKALAKRQGVDFLPGFDSLAELFVGEIEDDAGILQQYGMLTERGDGIGNFARIPTPLELFGKGTRVAKLPALFDRGSHIVRQR
jgi:hypothetical protein